MRSSHITTGLITCLVLAGCGGGGGGGGPTPQPGSLSFSTANYSVAENAGTASITVHRNDGGQGAVSIDYATTDGSATAGADYQASSGTLNWGDGDTTPRSFDIGVLDDSNIEGTETVQITLSNPTGGAALGSTSTASLSITDDDAPAAAGNVKFSLNAYSVSEGVGTATIEVQRVGGSTGAIAVDLATSDVSALSGTDYQSLATTLNWADGDSAGKSIQISIVDDSDVEPSETLEITLSNPQGTTILDPNPASLTIVDNDGSGGSPVTSTYLFFQASLHAIDPANPGQILLVDGRSPEDRSILDFIHGTLSADGNSISDLHLRTVMYIVDGKIWKVSGLLADGPPTPQQVSNETDAVNVCNVDHAPDELNHANSIYFYHLAGADGSCETADDVFRAVRIGDSASTSPIDAGWPVAANGAQRGAVDEVLAVQGNTLVRCNADFSNCVDVFSPISKDFAFELGGTDDVSLLLIGDSMRAYHWNGNRLSDPLHTFQFGFTPAFTQHDGNHLYFVDGLSIYRAPLDGSQAPTPIVTETEGSLNMALLHSQGSGQLVYSVSDFAAGNAAIKRVAKTGGTPENLLNVSNGTLGIWTVNDNWIYYSGTRGTQSIAGSMQLDGSQVEETTDAAWAGVSLANTTPLTRNEPPAAYLVLWNMGNGALTSYRTMDRSIAANLGSVDSAVDIFTMGAFGTQLLGFGQTLVNGEFMGDVYVADPTRANSLVQVTATPTVDERGL